jgi:hypothetical protein
VISDDPEALEMFREETTRPNHRPKKDEISSDNITTSERGTSRAYTLYHLADERSDLFARVKFGELSAKSVKSGKGFGRKNRA